MQEKAKVYTIGVLFKDKDLPLRDWVRELADDEDRSFSKMVIALIKEAKAARVNKDATPPGIVCK